jgi:hypothetical protein
MAKSIWKFQLHTEGAVEMPIGAKVISAREQGDHICLWAEVDPKMGKVERWFSVYGTGWPLPDEPGEFIGTALLSGGALVFHVYERRQQLAGLQTPA